MTERILKPPRQAALATPRPLEKNVSIHLEKIAGLVGKAQAEKFKMFAGLDAIVCCDSPIERLMLIAFEAMGLIHPVDVRKAFTVEDLLAYEPEDHFIGVCYLPQAPIEGGYIADFVVRGRGHGCAGSDIAIELDGHAFHDRDQTQRSYEKRRDREFQHAGLRVFRYTGADVVRDPMAIATEVFKSLSAI